MARLITVGITGPTGSGKTSLRAPAELLGFDWLDSDITAREVVAAGQPALFELAERFGGDIILPDGTLDRPLLAKRAFSTPEGCAALNAITHPRVVERLRELSAESFSRGRHVIIDAPLLFEANVDALCDCTVAVTAPDEIRLRRITERDGLSEEAARLRMNAQPSAEFYTSRADFSIFNGGSREEFILRGREMLNMVLNKYGGKHCGDGQ